jgi:hypothetical protein
MKNFTMFMVLIASFIAGGCKSKIHIPTSPSETTTTTVTPPVQQQPATNQTVDLAQFGVVKIEQFITSGGTIHVYGNIAWLFTDIHQAASKLAGSDIRARVYDGITFKTWQIGYANSAPVGDFNAAIIREILFPNGKVDIALILQPYGCVAISCWIHFTFPDMAHTIFLPSNRYKAVKVGDLVHIQGDLPAPSLEAKTLGFAPMSTIEKAKLVDEGYIDSNGHDVVTKVY